MSQYARPPRRQGAKACFHWPQLLDFTFDFMHAGKSRPEVITGCAPPKAPRRQGAKGCFHWPQLLDFTFAQERSRPDRRQGAKAPRVVFTDPNFWIACWEVKRGQDRKWSPGVHHHRRQGAKAPRVVFTGPNFWIACMLGGEHPLCNIVIFYT